MMKKVWLVLLAVVLVFGLAMFGCKSGGDDENNPGGGEDVVIDLLELLGSNSLTLNENGYGDGYQNFITAASPKDSKFTKGEEWELEIAFKVSRDIAVGLEIGLVDQDGGWDPLSWDTAAVPDPFTTDALTKDTAYDLTGESKIIFKVFKNAGGKTAKANSIMFQTEGEFTPKNSGGVTAAPSTAPGPVTITFTKATFTKKATTGGEGGEGEAEEVYEQGTEGATFDATVGKKQDIGAQGSAAFDAATGILDFTHVSTAGDYDDGALFTLILPTPTNAAGTKKIKIKYFSSVETGNEVKFTLKEGGWSDAPINLGTFNQYPTFTSNAVATYEIPENIYADETEKLYFQRNGDKNAFKIKIISVVME